LLPLLIESSPMESEARARRFEGLYSAHSAEILRFAVRCGARRQDAEEVVIETFLVCWRRLDQVPDPAIAWLLGVAKYVLLNDRRSNSRRQALFQKLAQAKLEPSPASSDDGISRSAVMEAFSRLDASDKQVLELLVWREMSQEEAANVIGCSRNAVTKRFRQARRRLQALLPPIRT
jgi:RNA polymerase sigma-70 factor, ECF subfamily